MSNSGSVGGSGGVDVSSPYTNGTSHNASKTGETDGGRKVTVNPDTEQTSIPRKHESSGSPTSSSLKKRKISPHSGDNKLKPMPGDGDSFKPLSSKDKPTGKKVPPAGSPENPNPMTGQSRPQPGVSPRVTVESSGALTPLPPLTPEQQQHKNKLAGAFTAALGFVKGHKNSFAMGGGAALMVAGIALMAFPPTAAIGIFPAVLGFTMATTGFSFAMTNTENGAPAQPPEPPKNEKKEEDGKKKENVPDDGSSSPSSPATPKGHFVKVDHSTGESVTRGTEPEETSSQAMEKKREELNLQRHMQADLSAALQQHAEAVSKGLTQETSLSTSLENKILEIAAEYAARSGLKAEDDLMVSIVESGKLMARTLAETEGMPNEKRLEEFQKLFVPLIQRPEIPEEAVRLLCGVFDSLLEESNGSINEAARAILRSTSELLKSIHRKPPQESSEGTSNTGEGVSSSNRKQITLTDLEAALNDIHNPDKDLQNVVHMRALRDAIVSHGQRVSMTQSEIEQVKNRLFTDALDLLDEYKTKDQFVEALTAKIDSVSRREDLEFLNQALKGHKWFRAGAE